MPPKLSLKQLQVKWYKRLKESGFDDIEYGDGSIKSCKPRSVQGLDPSLREAIEDYYRMSMHFLNEHKFESELEKVIWEYHANGISVRDITKILADTKVKKTSRDTIWRIVKRLENKMKHLYLSV